MSDETETAEPMSHDDEIWARVEARQAAEDAPYDEYGIAKPHKSHTERWTDEVAPPELMNDAETSYLEKIGRGFLAAPVALAGHFADNLNIFEGNFPIFSEIAHSNEEARYRQQRRDYEAALAQQAYDDETAAAQAQYAPEPDAGDPEVAQSWYGPEAEPEAVDEPSFTPEVAEESEYAPAE